MVIAILFVAGMIWIANPFASVEEVVLPNFVGLTYDMIVNDELYEDFDIVVEIEEPNVPMIRASSSNRTQRREEPSGWVRRSR